MTAYYNEIEPFAAQWLRNLIAAGHIAPGDVDERDIRDVSPDDLRGYTQCHFFAGIGVWSYALRLAGWGDDQPVWTGSCPCQPFSAAGKGGGFDDERHLWPAFYHLISQCRPPTIFGEQVASKDGLAWLDLVQADMEGAGYAFAAADLCAAGVGAPHIRQRLWFVADTERGATERHGHEVGSTPGSLQGEACERQRVRVDLGDGGATRRLGDDDDDEGLEGQRRGLEAAGGRDGAIRPVAEAGESGGVADPRDEGEGGWGIQRPGQGHEQGAWTPCERPAGLRANGRLADTQVEQFNRGSGIIEGTVVQERDECGSSSQDVWPGPTNGFWRDADWLLCRDGKWRPVEPGTFPLAHGAPVRVGRLRAYGNAIVAPCAQAFIEAYLATRP